MFGGELGRIFERNDRIIETVQQQARLRKIGERPVLFGVLEQAIAQLSVTSCSVMKDGNGAVFSPIGEFFGAKFGAPKLAEVKGGREQDEAFDFGVFGGEERGEIAAQAGTDHVDGFAADGVFDDQKLAGERQIFEIGRQIERFGGNTVRGEFFNEIAGFAGLGTGGEAVEINDTHPTLLV